MEAPGAALMEYHRKLAMSQVPRASILPPGYIDRLHEIEEEVRAENEAKQAELKRLWADDSDKED